MNKKSIIALGFLLIAALGALLFRLYPDLLKNGASTAPPAEEKLRVTASFYPLYFFASEIGGVAANVYNLTPAGAEPHDYEPTPQDIVRLHQSRLVIVNGAGLEPWSESALLDIKKSDSAIVVSAADQLATLEMTEDGKEMTDPHIWLNPALAEKEAEIILQGFLAADPDNAAAYTANAQALKDKLKNLHDRFQAGLAACASRDIITSHAGFSYLAQAYILRQVALTGLSPDQEPSPRELASIADFARQNKVRYIFFEDLVSPKLAETLAREVGAATLVLNPIEGLADKDIAAGANYFSEMNENLANLKIALQCQ